MLLAMLTLWSPAAFAQQGQAPLTIQILGNSGADEDADRQWVAVLAERPIKDSAQGYEPDVPSSETDSTPLRAEYEVPIQFVWNFGDGTGRIYTEERPSITHNYPDNGDFTMRVEAISEGQVFATGEKLVKVRNRRPRFPLLAAVLIDPASNTFELAAQATEVPADPLTYEWDFGDGQTLVSDQWRREHSYQPGRYTVQVKIKDDEGEEARNAARREIVVRAAGASDDDTVSPLSQAPQGAAQTSVSLSVKGGIDFQFTGEIHPTVGIYLAPRKPASGCRFLLTAWDNANLAYIGAIFDLKRVDPEGATYTFNKPRVWFKLASNPQAYEQGKRLLSEGNVMGGISQQLSAIPGVAELDEEQLRALGNTVGIQPGAAAPSPTVPVAGSSPFGLEDAESFETERGTAQLIFIPRDRAVGRLAVQLRNTDSKSPYQSVALEGDFVLDLEAERRNGLMLDNECGPADLQIERVSPEDGETFFLTRRPNVNVYFSDSYAPESLNPSTFQLTYPAPGIGEPVPVDVRLFRRDNSAWIKPEQDLFGGVRYTARIKTGEDGVRDLAGNPIPDENGMGWYTWSFSTAPNFVPTKDSAAGDENIACHVFQTVRDAPLIAGKPAVARIYANWKRHPEVNDDAQVREFTGRIALLAGQQEIATDFVRFVRPDLWDSAGIDTAKAQHTANLFFNPTAGFPSSLRVKLEMPADLNDSVPPTTWSSCSTPIWSLAPKIKVQWYLIKVDSWLDKDIDAEVKPWVVRIMREAETVAQQLFPVQSVEMEYGGVMTLPLRAALRDYGADAECNYDEHSTMIIGIMPGGAEERAANLSEIAAGNTYQKIGVDGPVQMIFPFDLELPESEQDRYVFGIVHEMGHSLWLDHLPYFGNGQAFASAQTAILRNEAWANNYIPRFWYQGIEGFWIAPDGKSGMNKSSTEGNAESTWLSTLMYPSTMHIPDMFIARHHYLWLMQTWQKNGGISKPDDVQ